MAADTLDPPSPPSGVLEILVMLPSGSVLPARGPPGEPLRMWKARLLAHCGIDPAREHEFGLALGFSPLDDDLAASSCDLQTGDRLTLYERQGSASAVAVARREAEVAGLC